ncbi:prolyl oligopeptidase family serine peptidase [Pistricoccus aurantiacus]|uniref:extracellular catalytic domain type 2 short-chain-length polyhydroxyalkanoate depolymerase n=1 Tax=Pistricoccus aurantiacus TaxID=1883414 RepID=UPI0036338141
MHRNFALAILSAGLGLCASALAEEEPPSLESLHIDPDRISVMGVSSGGYMATQLAVAYPEVFSGLGVFAAGPWGCSQGELSRALRQCMAIGRGLPSLAELDARLEDYRRRDLLGEANALAEQRVYLWQGEDDEVVQPQLGAALARQYSRWLTDSDSQLKLELAEGANHGWPVARERIDDPALLVNCRAGGAPYLLDCDSDGAGRALDWLYGDLAPPSGESQGNLRTFDQEPFDDGLAERGYLYVPESCAQGKECGLVMALHGCRMSSEQIGEQFVRNSGLDAWADTNRLVVIYPQATPSLPNPLGCWDWWGYEESMWQPSPLHDSRDGEQLGALMRMIRQLAGLSGNVSADNVSADHASDAEGSAQ